MKVQDFDFLSIVLKAEIPVKKSKIRVFRIANLLFFASILTVVFGPVFFILSTIFKTRILYLILKCGVQNPL